jgi:hypothetical protein
MLRDSSVAADDLKFFLGAHCFQHAGPREVDPIAPMFFLVGRIDFSARGST